MPRNTTSAHANCANNSNLNQESTQETSHSSQTMEIMATTSRPAYTQEYSLPSKLESQA